MFIDNLIIYLFVLQSLTKLLARAVCTSAIESGAKTLQNYNFFMNVPNKSRKKDATDLHSW